MKRKRVKFRNGFGGFSYGWAVITDNEYIWCFDKELDNYGFTIKKADIIKIY